MSIYTKISLVVFNIFYWMVAYWVGTTFFWDIPPFTTADGSFFKPMLFGNFINAIILYTNAFLFYPFLFKRKRKVLYFFVGGIFILLMSTIEGYADYAFAISEGKQAELVEIYGGEVPIGIQIFGFSLRASMINSIYFLLSFILIFPLESYKNKKQQEFLVQERIKTEIKFLRSQINPHFLFNGINSIYHLIDQDGEQAKKTLINFSDLLRYQLYECNDESVSIAKEVKSLEDFIGMEQTRRHGEVTVITDFDIRNEGIQISPMLFLPFLENAFKYVSKKDDPKENIIQVSLKELDNKIIFKISNSYDPLIKGKTGESGIGFDNVKKRLELIYPKKYDLQVANDDNIFLVNLKLNLK